MAQYHQQQAAYMAQHQKQQQQQQQQQPAAAAAPNQQSAGDLSRLFGVSLTTLTSQATQGPAKPPAGALSAADLERRVAPK
jgi:hypothetical protein